MPQSLWKRASHFVFVVFFVLETSCFFVMDSNGNIWGMRNTFISNVILSVIVAAILVLSIWILVTDRGWRIFAIAVLVFSAIMLLPLVMS